MLRADLAFHMQEYQGEPCYLIEDELNSRFFRIGIPEYNLISLFDGSTTVSAAVAQSSASMGSLALAEHEAITICKWLLDSSLATTGVSRTADRLYELFEEANSRKTMATANPITPKFKLFNPDAVLGSLNGLLGWLFSFPAFVVWLCVVLVAIYHVWANWSAATSVAGQIFSGVNWIWLAVTWIILKLIHETAHGIACKKFSGDVRSAGLVLIVLIPLPFVDVTSSWRFPSKWHRIFVAAAGMYVEIFVAGVAALVWCNSDTGLIRFHAFNVMLAGSVTTLLFNANPLMRFDGYYMLTDWLEMPNLATHGQQFLKWTGRKFYLGLDVKRPAWPEGRGWLVVAYSLAAFAWRILICVSLALAAESLMFGAGVALAAIATAMWVFWPVGKLLKFVFVGSETEQRPGRIRFCGLTTGLVAVVWAVGAFVPWHARIEAPAIVNFRTIADVRSPVGGFVRTIHVRPDQAVAAGDLIATLENPELEFEIKRLEIDLERSRLKSRVYRNQDNISGWNVELETTEALKKQLDERRQQKRGLEIRAGIAGQVIADEMRNLEGVYLPAGHLLCSIGMEGPMEVHALVSQHDFERFSERTGAEIDVHIWGHGPADFVATLDQVNPRARVRLPHPAFSSTNGGPLPVKYRSSSSSGSSHGNGERAGDKSRQQPFELVDPRFAAVVSLTGNQSTGLCAGQPGFVSFRTSRGTVGEVVGERCLNWFRTLRRQINSQ